MIRAALIAALLAIGCGDNQSDGLLESFSVTTDPGDDHPHTLTLFGADIAAGLPQTYLTTGGPGHEHAVDISGDEMMTLEEGLPVIIEFTDGHPHRFDVEVP